MQKSTVNGSQGRSGVGVIVGIPDGVTVVVGDGDVAEGMAGEGAEVLEEMIFVFTEVGVSDMDAFSQETRTNSKRNISIGFIKVSQRE
jgi:hypothetical protein